MRFGQSYSSTVVIHVNEAGLYQCKVTLGSQLVRGNMIMKQVVKYLLYSRSTRITNK